VRRAFYGDGAQFDLLPSYGTAMAVSVGFGVLMFLLSVWLVRRRRGAS
jgi:hypothetical protein